MSLGLGGVATRHHVLVGTQLLLVCLHAVLHALLFDKSDSLLIVTFLSDVVLGAGKGMLGAQILHVEDRIELLVHVDVGAFDLAAELLPVVLQIDHVAPLRLHLVQFDPRLSHVDDIIRLRLNLHLRPQIVLVEWRLVYPPSFFLFLHFVDASTFLHHVLEALFSLRVSLFLVDIEQ